MNDSKLEKRIKIKVQYVPIVTDVTKKDGEEVIGPLPELLSVSYSNGFSEMFARATVY
jgi:hypothetical protein